MVLTAVVGDWHECQDRIGNPTRQSNSKIGGGLERRGCNGCYKSR